MTADAPAVPTPMVVQLRVVLAGISPLIWRRLLVSDQMSVAELHTVLQVAFGWSDEHLHRFTIHGVGYGLARPGSGGFARDARRVRLAAFGLRVGERFVYDGTQHLPEIALPPTESTLAINDHAVTPLLAPRSITMITHKLQTETR